ncbi:hypothetical protein [Xanthomonas sp. 4461]|uniref:DUF3325 domain-containing protein n=1 Tax=Xanthomonas sp. 10-10 TaxID=3115848 RepID=A0AAU7P630_9XANT|nr:hypothetical protein [Xanthomonas sp. 4461]MCS3808154.1 hypothetical protein [Xanthomonas sp. 4461]
MLLIWVLLAYLALLGLDAAINEMDFRRSPDKGERYRLLPLPYKLCCWFGVIPLCVGMLFWHGALGVVVCIALAALQSACVRWYQKAGLLPRND